MSAPTVQPAPSTRRTNGNDTAPTAASSTPLRIDDFIKRKLKEARTGDTSGISDSANRAAQLGFGACANVRYSEYLAAFQSSPRLTEKYREIYPNSVFLPWPAFHKVVGSLKLWVDLPGHYLGAVPPEQLPWVEIFTLQDEDHANPADAVDAFGGDSKAGLALGLVAMLEGEMPGDHELGRGYHFVYGNRSRGEETHISLHVPEIAQAIRSNRNFRRRIEEAWRQLSGEFFVVAPSEAFNTTEDWFSRTRRLVEAEIVQKVPPDDPLVIRFCRGGCLVVAAWGEEGAHINALAREAGI